FFQAEDGIRDFHVTGVQTCALPICVLYQPHAFETVTNGRIYNNPSNEAIRAARDAVNGWDPSGGALYFFNPAKVISSWVWTRTIVNRIGKHVFAIRSEEHTSELQSRENL